MSDFRTSRMEAKLSQEELAREVDVSVRHIAFIEKGERVPSLLLAYKISRVLNKSIEDIFLSILSTKST